MQALSLFELIKQVVTSWQVIVVTIVLALFLKIVFFAARSYHRPLSMPKINLKKKRAAENVAAAEEVQTTDNEDLGLEEE